MKLPRRLAPISSDPYYVYESDGREGWRRVHIEDLRRRGVAASPNVTTAVARPSQCSGSS